MRFEDFIKKGLVKKCSKDSQLLISLIKSVDNDLKFLDRIKIDDLSARKVFSNYYDTFRSVLEAKALLDNYKVYSHEAFTYFLKDKGDDALADKFDRFRKIRNKINYYGENISVEEVKQYREEMILLIKKIKNEIQIT